MSDARSALRSLASFAVALVAAAGACRAPHVEPGDTAPVPSEVAESPATLEPVAADARQEDVAVAWSVVGHSVEGRPLEVAVLGTGELCVLVLASIHGDEAAGTPLVHELARRALRDPASFPDRKLVLVPVANPDGVHAKRRFNAQGIDLNRNFPADNWTRRRGGPEPLSAPESRALHELVLRHAPERIVSLHQPADRIDWDGPAEELARAVAQATTLPLARMGARKGSLGSWAGVDRGLEVLTIELPGSASRATPEDLWERYGALLETAIRFEAPAARAAGE